MLSSHSANFRRLKHIKLQMTASLKSIIIFTKYYLSFLQAGFNFGDGTRYYSVQGSQTDLIRQLPTLTNVGVPGMFMFRVDEAEITNGGCNTAGLNIGLYTMSLE